MAETISWCRVHDGNPDDCERKIAWDESCDVVELIDPANVDYEAARDALMEANPPLKPPYWGIDVLARIAVDAALRKEKE